MAEGQQQGYDENHLRTSTRNTALLAEGDNVTQCFNGSTVNLAAGDAIQNVFHVYNFHIVPGNQAPARTDIPPNARFNFSITDHSAPFASDSANNDAETTIAGRQDGIGIVRNPPSPLLNHKIMESILSRDGYAQITGPLRSPVINFCQRSNSVPAENKAQCDDWFFGKINRRQAERLLTAPGNTKGSFLIRESETFKDAGSFSLSILNGNRSLETDVDHYRVLKSDGGGYYIIERAQFDSLKSLVQHYMDLQDGLCCKLIRPCQRTDDVDRGLREVLKIPRESLNQQALIKSGQFGEIWKGLWKGTNDVTIRLNTVDTQSSQDFLEEANVLDKMRHENIVILHGVIVTDPVGIVMEFMHSGSLLEYLKCGKDLNLREKINMALQIASGMAYVGENNYVHRNLRAANVYVSRKLVCKLSGFHMARCMKDDGTYVSRQERIAARWTAPEAAVGGRFSVKSDVWSFGVLMAEIVSRGKTPYDGMTNEDVIRKVHTGFRMPKPDGCPDNLYHIMLQCWHEQATERPDFEKLRIELPGVGQK